MTRRTKQNEEQAPKIIGMETTYIGHERRHGGHGAKMLVTAIFRYDEDEDSPDSYVTDNERLAELGGLRPEDGVEIHAWLPKQKRWSFVGDELETIRDLACFTDDTNDNNER